MLTSKDIALLTQAGLKTNFFSGYRGDQTIFEQVCTTIPSNQKQENYAWLGNTPRLRQWVSERVPKALQEHGFSIVNKDWESTIAVDRNAQNDDISGQTKIRVNQLGAGAKKDQNLYFSEVVEAGTSELCYDGQYFFDTDHSEGASGTQINYFNGASYVFGATAVKAAMTAMRGFKDDTGRKAGMRATHVMVPAGLEWTADELFNPAIIRGVTTDPAKAQLAGKLQVIVNPDLTEDATVANSAWYLLDLSQPVKPFIYQLREDFKFTALDNPDSYDNFMRKTLYYGVEARFEFGYGDWRGAIRLGNT